MLTHRDSHLTPLGASGISRDEIVAFTQTLLAKDVTAANVIVAELREVGCTIDAIYLQLLAPSARYLGELWEADTCNFSEVTLCLWRIQTMLYDLSPAFQSDAMLRAAALFCCAALN
jgi:MerR family transcriptional regulator, light-induced transcriptional regulator